MIIPINDDIRIVSDCHQWTIQRSRKRTVNGKPDQAWEAQSYYPTPLSAIRAVGERLVRDSDAVGFIEALAEVERVATELSQALLMRIEMTCPHCGQETCMASLQ